MSTTAAAFAIGLLALALGGLLVLSVGWLLGVDDDDMSDFDDEP